jgi:hypothetical protein
VPLGIRPAKSYDCHPLTCDIGSGGIGITPKSAAANLFCVGLIVARTARAPFIAEIIRLEDVYGHG